jgi:hypothetical protein
MLNVIIPSVVMLNVVMPECRYAVCRGAEKHASLVSYKQARFTGLGLQMMKKIWTMFFHWPAL